MSKRYLIRPVHGFLAALVVVFFPAFAQAVPSFAQQTGPVQPATSAPLGRN